MHEKEKDETFFLATPDGVFLCLNAEGQKDFKLKS